MDTSGDESVHLRYAQIEAPRDATLRPLWYVVAPDGTSSSPDAEMSAMRDQSGRQTAPNNDVWQLLSAAVETLVGRPVLDGVWCRKHYCGGV